MYRKSRYPKWAQAACTSVLLAVSFMILATRTCDAFPVDFILTAPGEAKQPELEVQVAKEAPVEVKEVADPKPAAGKAKPVKRGIVREKAAVVAVGAAEAAEEVGQVLGDLIGGLFGRGNRGEPAIAGRGHGCARDRGSGRWFPSRRTCRHRPAPDARWHPGQSAFPLAKDG